MGYVQMINVEERWRNYIKDKRIIFVAPSSYLIDMNKGKFIDGFDINVHRL